MICEERIHMQLPSEPSEVNLDPQERLRLRAAMALAVVALKKCRIRKLMRESQHRRYKVIGHIIRKRAKEFRDSERGKQWTKEYQSRRRKEHPEIHFLNWLRGSINRDIRRQGAKKGGRTEQLIGCTFAALRFHLESQFTNGMSWENRSAWDVDHIVPISAFDLKDSEEQQWAFKWRNMRPMSRVDNQKKSDTIPDPLPSWLPAHIADRIKSRQPSHPPAR